VGKENKLQGRKRTSSSLERGKLKEI